MTEAGGTLVDLPRFGVLEDQLSAHAIVIIDDGRPISGPTVDGAPGRTLQGTDQVASASVPSVPPSNPSLEAPAVPPLSTFFEPPTRDGLPPFNTKEEAARSDASLAERPDQQANPAPSSTRYAGEPVDIPFEPRGLSSTEPVALSAVDPFGKTLLCPSGDAPVAASKPATVSTTDPFGETFQLPSGDAPLPSSVASIHAVAGGAAQSAAVLPFGTSVGKSTIPEPSGETSLFREEALRARLDDSPLPALPEIAGTRWAALSLVVSLVGVMVGVAVLGRVEVISEAQGTLRASAGPRPVTVQSSGVVASLAVKPGTHVTSGQEIARIESSNLGAALARASGQLDLLREEGQKASGESQARYSDVLQALKKKRRLLRQRAALKRAEARRLRVHARRMRALADDKVALETEALAIEQSAAGAMEQLLSLRQQADEVGIEIADRGHSLATERVNRELQTRRAEIELAEAKTMVMLGQVRAPVAGRLESLLVSERQVVQAGQVVAQIVPDGTPSRVVVFAPQEDAPFLRPGLSAKLEFPSLPVSEFGRAQATVTRVAGDRPLPAEVANVLGGEARAEALVRVELAVVDDEVWRKMAHRLHSGAQVTARLQTRERRIASLLFDFLR